MSGCEEGVSVSDLPGGLGSCFSVLGLYFPYHCRPAHCCAAPDSLHLLLSRSPLRVQSPKTMKIKTKCNENKSTLTLHHKWILWSDLHNDEVDV